MRRTGATLREGDVIDGRYIVRRCLGAGGMGEVYLVDDRVLACPRALKLLFPELAADDPVFKERFIREARIAARLHHRSLVSVQNVDFDAANGFCYIVMEYISGGSVRDLIKRGVLSEDRSAEIILQTASALIEAGSLGLVHRDIKPENIMIDESGCARLADLGIAKSAELSDVTLTLDDDVLGTPAYASPEQCLDSHHVDCRADIYSLGVTLFEMLTGRRPYLGANAYDTIDHVLHDPLPDPGDFRNDLSSAMRNLVMRMMAKNPKDRPQTPEDLRRELTEFQAERLFAASPELDAVFHRELARHAEARLADLEKQEKQRRKIAIFGFALIAVLLFFLAVAAILTIRTPERKNSPRALELERLKAEQRKQLDLYRAAYEKESKNASAGQRSF